MWESRRDFHRVWEGWEAGFMAFHAFHTLSFPWSAFRLARLDKQRRHPAQWAAPATKCLSLSAYRYRLSISDSAILYQYRLVPSEKRGFVTYLSWEEAAVSVSSVYC